ncbi:helix-turn-helix domain-containing protein [Natronoarchaeum rubrum]|uniref:helix-turn-helix domain-containing protein n=1 Tax=Natronoarchaeum rubrum TaxID=755311 RepID=UPI0021123406|nr:helix-turn-helix domain-containing protein [Natronoarchaeum rubrum]
MTDDTDLCGYEKDDGEPCGLPASKSDGRCHHHTDDDVERARGGRPTKLEQNPELYDEIMAAAEEGLTYEGIARVAGIGRSTLDDWRREYDEFSARLEQKRSVGERELVQDADPEFILERSYDYTKEQEIEHTGDGFDLSLSADEKEHLDELFDVDPQETDTDE